MSTKLLVVAVAAALAGPEAMAVADVMGMMGAFSKGSTPNKYKPHQGKRAMTLSRQGQRKLEEWAALLNADGWSKPDKQYLVDYWLEHHDADGVVIAKGHPQYNAPHDEGKTK